jgi:hypothetical protein
MEGIFLDGVAETWPALAHSRHREGAPHGAGAAGGMVLAPWCATR